MEAPLELERFRVGNIKSVFYIPEYVSKEDEALLLSKVYTAPATSWKQVKGRRLQNLGGLVHPKGLLPSALPPWLSSFTRRLQNQIGLFPKDINHVLVNEYHPGQEILAHEDGPLYWPVVAIVSLGLPAVITFTPTRTLLEASAGTPTNVNPNETVGNSSGGEGMPDAPSLPIALESASNLPQKETLANANPDEAAGHDSGGEDTGFEGASNLPQKETLELLPRSLLVFMEDAYTGYLHGVHVPESSVASAGEKEEYSSDGEKKEDSSDGEEKKEDSSGATRVSLTCRLVPKVMPWLLR